MRVLGIGPRIAARFREAADRPGALWAQAACLAGGAAMAWLAARRFAWAGDDLEAARRLGVISATTLAGYAKSRDTHAYLIAVSVGLLCATALWIAWCRLAARGDRTVASQENAGAVRPASKWRWRELALVTALLVPGLLRFDLAVNGWDAPYTFYSEEGEAVAWADVALHGGVLSRDTYCLYGPLATYPIVAAFALLGPSVTLWRLCVYLLDVPALLAVYLLLRELARSRWAAGLGVALVCFHRMWPMPAMSWSLMRTGLGLAAIAAAANHLRTGRRASLVLCGAALGTGLLFSQEAGLAAALAVSVGLVVDAVGRGTDRRTIARDAATVVAGLAAVAGPILAWHAARGGAASLIANLFGFAKLRVLGHGGQPFPGLAESVAAWFGAPSGETLDALLETLAAYFGPVLYVFAAFRIGTRLLAGRYAPEVAVYAALIVYGCVLFVSPLTRPDTTHVLFATPPAFVIVVDQLARAIMLVRRSSERVARRSAAAAFVVVTVAGLAAFRTDTRENLRLFARQVGLNVTLRGIAPAEDGARTLEVERGGGVRIPADRADEIEAAVRYVAERTSPTEPVWAFPNEPMLNFLADRPLAGRYALALFAITRDQRLDLIASVEHSGARYAIVNLKPSMVDEIPSRAQVPELWAYVDTNFTPEKRFGRFEVRRRSSIGAPR
jgi:hypothetical protein